MGWVHGLLTAILIGISSNLDNAGVGIAYGAENIRFPHRINAIINMIGCLSALGGAYMGTITNRCIPPQGAAWAACGILCMVGMFILYSAYVRPRVSNDKPTTLQTPGLNQGVFLGLALSITNLACGFGATVSNVASVLAIVASITVWGYLTIWIGNVVGLAILVKSLGRYSSLAAGLVLIAVGVHQIL